MAKKISNRSTKAEIIKVYNELLAEKEAVEKSLKSSELNLAKAKKELETEKAKKSAVTQVIKPKTEIKEVIKVVNEAVKTDTAEGIITSLDSIQFGAGAAISDISAKMSAEAERLAEIQKEITEKKEELTKLYDIKVENGILGELIEEYESNKESFEEKLKAQKDEFVTDFEGRQKTWGKEQEVYRRDLNERNEKAQKEYQREIEQYQYDLEHGRDLQDDEYCQKAKLLEEELQELEESKNEEWKEKEKEIKAKEDEFAAYKEKYDELEDKLDKAIRQAEYEGKGVIEKDAKNKASLLEKETEGQKRVLEMRIETLEKSIQNQENRKASLAKQLEIALKQAQELAVKAIEGSTNSQGFEAVREIALEQAKGQTKGK